MTSNRKYAILLVDDEPEILYSLKGLLRREYELHTAENAKEAMETLEKHEIHVIVTDQRMPEVTGSELLARTRVEYPDTVRIVFTGYADIKAVIDSVNNGSLFRYITKPWDPDDLLEVLNQATAAYDQLMERKLILRDVQSHLQRIQSRLASDKAQQPQGAADADALAEAQTINDQLLARISSFLDS